MSIVNFPQAEECEKQLHGVKTTIKHKKEEHAHAVANFHMFQLQEQVSPGKDWQNCTISSP